MDLWKTAILKRAKYLQDEITRVRIIYGNKFDSVKLQVADKDDITTIYSIQFFNTGSVTMQVMLVSGVSLNLKIFMNWLINSKILTKTHMSL